MRTEAEIQAGYVRYRGKCKEACEEIAKVFPQLRVVSGHIFVAFWPSDPLQPHWWLKAPDGRIIDPTWAQFPFAKKPDPSRYEEFDPETSTVTCDQCDKEGLAKDFDCSHGRYCFCSDACHMRFVGL